MSKKKIRKKKIRNQKVGRPPGEILYTGKSTFEGFNLTQRRYNTEDFDEKVLDTVTALQPVNSFTVNWIEYSGYKQVGNIQEIADHYGIHQMHIEDVVNTNHLPKFEEGEDYIAIILKAYLPSDNGNSAYLTSVCVILKSGIVIDLHEQPNNFLDPKIERIKQAKGKARFKGPDYLFYVLLDAYIDTYYLLLDNIQDRIFDLENDLLKGSSANRIEDIHDIQKELTGLRKYLLPLRDAIITLVKEEPELINEDNLVYFSDLKDHLNQLVEYYFSYTDMIKSLIDLNNSNINNNINQVMKVLTIIATIFIPLTFIAGIYGMNFKNMPELKYEYGYPIVIAVMFIIGISMFIYMKIKNWF